LAPRPGGGLRAEPFSALDTGLRAAVREEVAATLRAAGTTAVLVTHDQVEAMSMADTVAVMRAGEIVQVAPPTDLYHRPADEWTARFTGDVVAVAGVRAPGSATVDPRFGPLPLAPGVDHAEGPEVHACWRPEQLAPAPEPGTEHGGPGAEATVTDVRFLGPDALVALDVDGLHGTPVTARRPSVGLPRPGDRVRVVVTGDVLAYPLTEPGDERPTDTDP